MNEALRAILKAIFASMFGSEAGGTGYPIAARPSATMALTAVVIVVIALTAVRFSVSRLRKNEWALVALWLALAFTVQLALSNLAYAPLSRVVESKNANGFYFVSQEYTATTLLAHFHEIADTFPLHARANLPGKTLLFDALGMLTSSTRGLAYLIILLSNLGGILLYLVARAWFHDPLTAFYSLVLYLFLPAKIYFFPLLNVVSPVLMLLVFWLATRALSSRWSADSAIVGAALYALTIFEPLPLAAMPMLAAVAVKPIVHGDLTWPRAASMAGWIAAGFGVVYLAMRVIFGFDLASAVAYALADARAFNEYARRPYSVWIVHNLKDFFINMGIAQSLVFFIFVAVAVRRLIASPPTSWVSSDVVLPIAFLGVLLALDLAGVNRGETVRLWIFLGVLMQIFVARACATWAERRLFEPMLAVSLVQATICSQIVAWIIP